MLVVSDTSPLRALAHLELLDLLERLYGSVVIPPAVSEELAAPPQRFKPLDVGQLRFLRVVPPLDQALVDRLRSKVDAGEAQAIALAIELHPDALLIDEAAGRTLAGSMGLRTIGTLGVLGAAKSAGLVPDVRTLVDRLIHEINFYLDPRLVVAFLSHVGE